MLVASDRFLTHWAARNKALEAFDTPNIQNPSRGIAIAVAHTTLILSCEGAVQPAIRTHHVENESSLLTLLPARHNHYR
jgi:hypothetical protein